MKKITFALLACACIVSGCVSLTAQERNTLRSLKAKGITPDRPVGLYEKPNSPASAALLNILPGFGNFYLASGTGGDSSQYVYGVFNLLFWPLSVVWAVPEGVIDANKLNDREFVAYYMFDESGQEELRKKGYRITASGVVEKIGPVR